MNVLCSAFAALCLLFSSSQKIPPQPVSTPTPMPLVWPVRLPVLLYHYVEYVEDTGDTIRQSLNISPYTFEKQIQTLVNAGYTFLTAKEVGELFDGTRRVLPEKPVLITFDDGYRDFYTDVFPILKKYNAKATVYMIAGFVDYKNNLTETQIRELAASGLVDIGAHTVHHIGLKQASLALVEKEVTESKQILEDLIGSSVVSFAYPNGEYDDTVATVVRQAGFTTAVTTKPEIENGRENRFSLFRLRTGGRSGEALLQYLGQQTFKSW